MSVEAWQRPAWELLSRRLTADRLPHAILVQGPAGVGKRTLTAALVEAILCESGDPGEPACGGCQGCRLARAGTHPDLHRIGLEEDSRQLKVDQVRELCRRVNLTSSRGAYQVFVIDPADRMNRAAANAFLKTLEEPRAGSVIILVAEASHRLPATILSRCQRVVIHLPTHDQAMAFLQRHSQRSPEELSKALTAAGGSPGRALEFAERERAAGFDQTVADLEALVGGQADPVMVAERWAADEPGLRLQWMASVLSRAAWSRVRGDQGRIALTGQRDLASLTRIVEETHRTRQLLESTLRPELLLESLLIAWKQGQVQETGGATW